MKVIVLVGEMGSGKSHVGQRMARDLGAPFIEGDSLCNKEMARAIRDFKLISSEMIDDLVERMASEIRLHRIRGCSSVVVSQALYRREHRDELVRLLGVGYEVKFIWVRVGAVRHLRQLLSRPSGWRWVLYWLFSKPFFQPPEAAAVFRNDELLP